MKLQQLNENSNTYLTNIDDIKKYVEENFTMYSRTHDRFLDFDELDEKDFRINSNLSLDFRSKKTAVRCYASEFSNGICEVKINAADEFVLNDLHMLYNFDFLPNKCNLLKFTIDMFNHEPSVLKNIKIATKAKEMSFKDAFYENQSINSLNILKPTDEIRFDNCSLDFDFVSASSESMQFYNCKWYSFKKLNINNVSNLHLYENKHITSFIDIAHLNNRVNNLYMDANFIINYKHIDELKCGVLSLSKMASSENIINILLAKVNHILLGIQSKIIDDLYDLSDILKIITPYTKRNISERSDHVMDCAVELIDAGFEDEV